MQTIDEKIIRTDEDTMVMLDTLLKKWDEKWWDAFYEDKSKPIPFFTDKPDENLVKAFDAKQKNEALGKALDIGCGNGRNTIFMDRLGMESVGIDIAAEPIQWAKENAVMANSGAKFLHTSFFDYKDAPESYSHIHDSGCLHHIKPHRREAYLKKIHKLLNKTGEFTLVCFNLSGGTNLSDYDVYNEKSMMGGMGYSKTKLKTILEPFFNIIEMRQMEDLPSSNYFGTKLCWAVRLTKK